MKNGSKFEEWGKIFIFKKLSKNSQKIQGSRSRRADFKNIAVNVHRATFSKLSGLKSNFSKIPKISIFRLPSLEKRLELLKKRGWN